MKSIYLLRNNSSVNGNLLCVIFVLLSHTMNKYDRARTIRLSVPIRVHDIGKRAMVRAYIYEDYSFFEKVIISIIELLRGKNSELYSWDKYEIFEGIP